MIVAVGGGLPGPGYTLICDESIGANVWKALAAQVPLEARLVDGSLVDGSLVDK